ncbi:MAG TPA: hypothetical protein VL424_21160 [Pararobbsia sp.]|nr:hypothetical protein [Pararobbsia sp.]
MRHRYSGRRNHDPFSAPTPSQLAALTTDALEGVKYGIATLDKRVDRLEHRVDKGFEAVDRRFEAVDKRFDAVDKRFDKFKQDVDKRFDVVDKRFDSIDCKLSGLSDKVSGLSHKFYAASIIAAVLSSVGVACLSNLDKVIALASPAAQHPAR